MPNRHKNRTGEKYITTEGYEVEIIEYFNSTNCTIQFEDGLILKNIHFHNIKNGYIKNVNKPSVFNTGYVGDGKFKTRVNKEKTQHYTYWKLMLERCYCKKYIKRCPTYKDVTVCDEWHNFQNFAKWFEENYNPETMQGWQLDKDILVKGNKIYSPETCCFVPKEINAIFKTYKKSNYLLGVHKSKNRYLAIYNKTYLGSFSTEIEAHKVYNNFKKEFINNMITKWKDLLNYKVINAVEKEIKKYEL